MWLGIWAALGVISLIACIAHDGTSNGKLRPELFEPGQLIFGAVLVILGPLPGLLLLYLGFSMRNK